MNASCLRKIGKSVVLNWSDKVIYLFLGNFHQALDKYRQTHEKFPESKEVLQYLVRLCSDMNMDKGLDSSSNFRLAQKVYCKYPEQRIERIPNKIKTIRENVKRAC